ncbi:hypothetical protein ACPW96_17885 [Micromonospora sp. DT81.3]
MLGFSKTSFDDYTVAFYWFIAAYVVMIGVTVFFYARRGSALGQRI